MALDYFLELEGENPDWEACIQSLKSIGVIDLVVENGRFKHANLANSGMYCWSSKVPEDEDTMIASQGNHGCAFQSFYSIVFRVRVETLDESVDEIHRFCQELESRSSMGFVLSLLFEGVSATRDSRGLIWTWDNPR